MKQSVFILSAVVVLVACTHRGTVVQTGAPAAAAAVRDPDYREPFWSDTIRPLSTLSRGWNRIPGRFGTGCARDSIYAFKVRPGLPEKVMIFLNGGGACWRAQECDPRHAIYTMSADSANDVANRVGLLDYTNEKNPVRDWTMVFVPYCTGDLHLGTREIDYVRAGAKEEDKPLTIRHGGAANLEAVLDWVYVNFRSPRVVFVAGVDAGSAPTPVVAERMARRYPRARVVQLGDGAGALHSDSLPSILAAWGATEYLQHDPAFRSVDSTDFTLERLYAVSAAVAPRVHYAQVNAAQDASQASFLKLLGVASPSVPALLSAALTEIRENAPWFRSYTYPGKGHTILRSNALYGLTVDDTAFLAWLTDLINGESIVDVGGQLLVESPKKSVRKP